jgi:molybdenum ABC transporter molybdate-binding protein
MLTTAFSADTRQIAQHNSERLTVAVASNFAHALNEILGASEYWSEQNVRVVTGSSGVLYAQITKGAPFHVFFSADSERPKLLMQAGLAKPPEVYAIGRLVLWPVEGSSDALNSLSEQDARAMYIKQLKGLDGRLAIANPQLAPFGYAANEVLGGNEDLAFLAKRFVKGANVSQAFQFVDSGNARAGLLAQSLLIQAYQLLKDDKYTQYLLIPPSDYTQIQQSLSVIKKPLLHPQAEAFAEFILSDDAQNVLVTLGYARP